MTDAELIDYLTAEVPNARKVAGVGILQPDIIVDLDGGSVRISVQCGDDDCFAEAAYRELHQPQAGRARPYEAPFNYIHAALNRLTPPLPILDEDGVSILVDTRPQRLRIAVWTP
jgi:hypothetical protein